jgi:hypothetical protein
MKSKYIVALFAYFIVILNFLFIPQNAFAAKSDLPDYIREQLHKDITYTVITEHNISQLDNLISKAGKKHFLVVQVKSDCFNKDYTAKILSWVNNGGVVWFYDSRLAEFFGMKNSPLKKASFQGKPYDGGYGTSKVPGINTIAHVYPFAEHPVVTGVQSIQAFLMEVGNEEYSAVEENFSGTIPLMRVNIELKAVVAAKAYGKGWVLFKPLLWPDVLGGERFQANLMEFSGGYQVPKGEAPVIAYETFQGKPVNLPRYDCIILSDGQQIMGMITDKEFEFMGSDGNITKKVNEIDMIKIMPAYHEMVLSNGTSLRGNFLNREFSFKSTTGKEVKISKENIVSIKFKINDVQK